LEAGILVIVELGVRFLDLFDEHLFLHLKLSQFLLRFHVVRELPSLSSEGRNVGVIISFGLDDVLELLYAYMLHLKVVFEDLVQDRQGVV